MAIFSAAGWRFLPFFLFIILPVPSIDAATITGTVYNLYLEELDKAVVSIDTTPLQTIVSKNGGYTLQVPPGEYLLLALYEENATVYRSQERIVIEQDGTYVIDMILLPELDSGEDLLDNITQRELLPFQTETSPLGIIALVLVMFLVLYIVLTRSHFLEEEPDQKQKSAPPPDTTAEQAPPPEPAISQTSELEDEKEKLLAFIKEQGGRVTQKDIRKKFLLSEAKVSLLVADLEARNLIRKIKKGRSNIIVLH